jgi:hypothetical protein
VSYWFSLYFRPAKLYLYIRESWILYVGIGHLR